MNQKRCENSFWAAIHWFWWISQSSEQNRWQRNAGTWGKKSNPWALSPINFGTWNLFHAKIEQLVRRKKQFGEYTGFGPRVKWTRNKTSFATKCGSAPVWAIKSEKLTLRKDYGNDYENYIHGFSERTTWKERLETSIQHQAWETRDVKN